MADSHIRKFGPSMICWTWSPLLQLQISISEFTLSVFLVFGPHSQCKLTRQSIDMPSLYFQKNTLHAASLGVNLPDLHLVILCVLYHLCILQNSDSMYLSTVDEFPEFTYDWLWLHVFFVFIFANINRCGYTGIWTDTNTCMLVTWDIGLICALAPRVEYIMFVCLDPKSDPTKDNHSWRLDCLARCQWTLEVEHVQKLRLEHFGQHVQVEQNGVKTYASGT